MKKYVIDLEHLGAEGWVKLRNTVEAETRGKAVYKSFKQYVEAFRPSGPNLFGWFIKYIVNSVKEASNE